MRRRSLVVQCLPLVVLLATFVLFCAISPAFRSTSNVRNILVHSSSVSIVATGMTFVLLTGGIDLSVGAIMFLAAAIAGKVSLGDWPVYGSMIPAWVAVALIVPIGLICGAVNGALITGCRMLPFVVTLATLFIGRGIALEITQTRAMNLPASFLAIGHSTILGLPVPIWMLLLTVGIGQCVLSHTPFGRQLYALGDSPERARKAGLRTTRLIFAVYLISGLCAALGGIVSVAQLGAVSPTFGAQREFAAIAAAVLGGSSLTGGRGGVFPGTLCGALLIQTVETGLNVIDANPYSYPVIIGSILFAAVLLSKNR